MIAWLIIQATLTGLPSARHPYPCRTLAVAGRRSPGTQSFSSLSLLAPAESAAESCSSHICSVPERGANAQPESALQGTRDYLRSACLGPICRNLNLYWHLNHVDVLKRTVNCHSRTARPAETDLCSLCAVPVTQIFASEERGQLSAKVIFDGQNVDILELRFVFLENILQLRFSLFHCCSCFVTLLARAGCWQDVCGYP